MPILIFIFGLCFGSFLLVVGLRVPKHQDIIFSRSICDECHHQLKWYNLIPIFSYLFQKGQCSYCHKKIAPINLIMELATGILFLIGYLMYGLSYQYFLYLIVISLMLLIFITDFIYMIILDSPLLIAIVLIVVLKFVYLGKEAVLISLASGVLLFLVMLFIQFLGQKIFKRDALGGGDVKFAFIIGLISGLLGIGITLILTIPINMILKSLVDISNLCRLPIFGSIVLVIISVTLTMISGLIPSRIASKKDPVEALRTE